MSETNTTVLVITEADREQLIKWLSNLPSATLNRPAPTEAPATETPAAETAAEATAEETPTLEVVSPTEEAAPEVSVESQT